MNVSMFDLKKQYNSIKEEINSALLNVMESGAFILGEDVSLLEKEVADYLGCNYAVGVASGTDALMLALLACDIGKGDEVITTPFTFIATAEAITYCGASPVFVDINDDTFNIDASKIEEKITSATRAILPVHMFGQSADMDAIRQIAEKHGLKVIEDAAQAFGAEYTKKKIGTLGNAGCFSFFPTKNFGAYGEAGMVTTNDEAVAEKVKMLRVHGSKKRYVHEIIGYNSRLDTIQAAILRVKLKYIDKWNDARRKRAAIYNKCFEELDLVKPVEKSTNRHIYHQYTVRLKDRDSCKDYMQAKGIGTAVHYPKAIFDQKCYADHLKEKDFLKSSVAACAEVLSLPMYPELPEDHIASVCDCMAAFLRRSEL